MGPKMFLLLCLTVALSPANCELKSSRDDERARLPEFLTELDLASLEASQEDIEAIKTVVKRLAPEKNGEYQVYQGVMGQPGVDFPALTTIPTTTFSCRGLKGGYYADLETNCQVFHICDNGRKISFLCPNGTIFQQSQLICDWWFKVDCSKSAELYEQSAEQLAEDERRRAEAKRINSEFHRSNEANEDENGQTYRQSQNYDGRQNGRTNPFGAARNNNQIPGSSSQRISTTDSKTSTRAYDPNQIYSLNAVTPSQYNQINELATGNALRTGQDYEASQSANKNRHQQSSQSRSEGGSYRGIDRQRNQLVEGSNDETKRRLNYESRGAGKYPGSDHQTYHQPTGRSNQQSAGQRNSVRDGDRRNYPKSAGIDQSSNRPTPSYTETTTFRTSTPSPIREYQQFAESAAFASNRGNRFNEAYSSSQFNSYYNHNNNRDSSGDKSDKDEAGLQQKTTEKPRLKSSNSGSEKSGGNVLRIRVGQPSGFPTFQPIYKPRANDRSPEYDGTTSGTTSADVVATTEPYTDDDIQSNQAQTSHSDNFAYVTTTPSSPSQGSESSTEASTTDDSRNSVNDRTIGDFFENTTPTIISSGTYVNAKAFTSSGLQSISHHRITPNASGFTTSKPKFQESVQSSVTASSSQVTNPAERRELSRDWNTTNDSRNQARGTSKSSQRTSSSYRPSINSIGTSTEKPSRSLAQSAFTGKTLSPYDTSITYQQGKVMSTLGPYVPFTKNYAYSTSVSSTTTARPPIYTATVPAYSTTSSSYRASIGKTTGAKLRVSSAPGTARSAGRLASGSGAYLPEKKSAVTTHLAKKLEDRPLKEREHALSMLESLRDLEDGGNGTRNGLTVPTSSGPSTLHSLALYFATASDDFDVTAETRQGSESTSKRGPESSPASQETGIELPKSILTQHTIDSYADLFNLNNALEGNSSSKSGLDVGSDVSEESDDLDLQQSQGPVEGVRKSNGTRLRELAQVFTHALSAYLQDPDTFKKILTEIRPTEPSVSSDGYTTLLPTTLEDYPSVTKEKDEVLDFSDDTAPHRGRRPTTVYPATDLPVTTDRYDQQDRDTTTSGYYTTLAQNDVSDNNFAFEVNSAFGKVTSDDNDLTSGGAYYPLEASGPSGTTALDRPETEDPRDDYGDNYFPSGESNNKIGGFANNTTSYEPYGMHVKPFDATPISDNYVASSTPASYVTFAPEVSGKDAKRIGNSIVDGNRRDSGRATTQPFRIRYYESTPRESLVTAGSVYSSYRETGNDLATLAGDRIKANDGTSVATSRTIEAFDPTQEEGSTTTVRYEEADGDRRSNDHWTSSPVVTQLWETTVFVDPERINEGLVSGAPRDSLYSTVDYPEATATTFTSHGNSSDESKRETSPIDSTSPSGSGDPSHSSSPWGWSSVTPDGSDDSPTAFTLLPKSIHDGNGAATLAPIYTTRSSITTTTVTSSTFTSTSGLPTARTTASPHQTTSGRPEHAVEDNEVVRAHAMFGKLNDTSSDTLMRVMKQADTNATVRQLVLLLINHCNGPMNKTMEEEKEQLLDALLRMPVHQFTSEESRDLVAGINNLNLSIGKHQPSTETTSLSTTTTTTTTTVAPTITTEEPVITTFRSKKGRRLRAKLDENSPSEGPARKKNEDIATAESSADSNALSFEDTSASDARALELLRSLYTIAAKWG